MSGSQSNSKKLLDFWLEKPLDRIEDKARNELVITGTLNNVWIDEHFMGRTFVTPEPLDHESITDARWATVENATRQMAFDGILRVVASEDIEVGTLLVAEPDGGGVIPANEEIPLGIALEGAVVGDKVLMKTHGLVSTNGVLKVDGEQVGVIRNLRIDIERDRE